ncbi:ferric reduction oxidase 2-like [Cucurbita pepo subsp. pepo]|uniref:ferric reduction oxidase 2-like n=1 Tax=Cucurbita pepo subsp. pepo TaxID=3664 RepID=UPI000C9D3B07|nr:ferric reduction oxidase 2-like [Cucurbita pepo subsp. pepo]
MRVLSLAIRVLVFILFVGWLFIWFMMPTNTYRHRWLPKIQDKSRHSSYFGSEGTSLLMYTFPILFIAVLGCVYVHIERRCKEQNVKIRGNDNGLAMWKRPGFVKGPLGIVSWTELALLAMFVALLVWSFATYLNNSYHNENEWESRLGTAAYWLGVVGNICLVFLFFPVARGSSLLPLLGLTSESSIKYHIWLGHMTMAFFSAHGIGFVVYWAATHDLSQMLEWAKTDVSNVAGEVSLVCGLIIWATTFPSVRRKFFELFLYTHHLYILFIVFFIFHVGISYACIMLPGFYLFLLDRYLRFLQSRRRVRLLSARLLPCNTLELNFSKHPGLKYTPTSTLFLNIPCISKLQWHPFTVTSHADLEPETLSVVIKCEGTWSTKLYQTLSSPSAIDNHLQVSLEGPYGPVSTSFLQFDSLIMISGGSGITPFISIIRHLIHNSNSHQQIPKLLLISAFKNSSELTFLHLLLPLSGANTLENFQIEAYVTRDKSPKDENPQFRTVIFKPHEGDSPATAILGPNGWLWLAGIICSSFGIFLALMGIVTRYYIYPIDGNSNDVFNLSLRSFLHMLGLCLCIVIAATAAVIWNKRKLAKEGRQIQNVEGTTPNASPSAMGFDNVGEMELESVPFEALAQSVHVYYGERPNLPRILLERKGENVGVLASGPKKMRQEVAAICGSGLAPNLHFQSISFTW